MKFISPDFNHRYICKLANTLDIQFENDYKEIEKSDRTFIIWNKYGYLQYPQKKFIDKYNYCKKLHKENKPYYIVERGALPDSIFIDKNGFLYESSSYNKSNWNKKLNKNQEQKVKNYIEDFIQDRSSLESQKSDRLAKKEYFEKLDINPNNYKKIVFVPLQMHNDTVTVLWCDWIKNVSNFQLLITEMAKENPDILFLVKNHPNESKYMDSTSDNIVIVDDMHYKDSISYSDCVITINSGVGLQAMMWQKPVIILGKAFYKFSGINNKAENKNHLLGLIYKSEMPDTKLVQRFIYYLKFVFYSTCIMKDLGNNCSKPIKIDKITYEDINEERINHEKEAKIDKQRYIFEELLKLLPDFCLLKDTCLECIQHCELINIKDTLYIGTKLDDKTISILNKHGYKLIKDNLYLKDDIKINFGDMPKNIKQMSLWGNPVNVPFPVINYLQELYGRKWKNHGHKKIEKTKEKLNIVYTFNNYGWAFEFEANYYKKYSSHNIIPIHQKDLANINKEDIDIIVVPSAWHWVRDLNLNNSQYINEYKSKGIKFVSQYNSHIENKFHIKTADLIMPSSKYIYDELKTQYNYAKMVWFPHFIDTNIFKPKYKWNDFTLGFAGNFKNRFKRPEVIKRLENDFKINKKCDYHGHLIKGKNHSSMADFYNNIDVYISPSLSEGTPMTMLEAMSCEKIVFITDTGIAPYMLDKFFIIPNTTDEEVYKEFKKRINQLQKYSKSKILEVGQKNREKAKLLDWKNNVDKLDNFYKMFYNNNLQECENIANNIIKVL